MKKLILFATAFMIASGPSAFAQSEHSSSKHRRVLSSHARMQAHEPGIADQGAAPALIAPSYGYYGGGSGRMDDPEAEGRSGD
jgi:hypothetical protein